jgi:hypothetical protein
MKKKPRECGKSYREETKWIPTSGLMNYTISASQAGKTDLTFEMFQRFVDKFLSEKKKPKRKKK